MKNGVSTSFVLPREELLLIKSGRTKQAQLGLHPDIPEEDIPAEVIRELHLWQWNTNRTMTLEGSRAFLAAVKTTLTIDQDILEGSKYADTSPILQKYLLGHGMRVAIMAILIGENLNAEAGIELCDLYALAFGALNHDRGKLRKDIYEVSQIDGILNDEARRVMWEHPGVGKEMQDIVLDQLDKTNKLIEEFRAQAQRILDTIHLHHEQMDGNGYHKVSPQDIPLEALIVAVADTLDAAGVGRHYQKKIGADPLKHELCRSSGQDFDPEVLFRAGRGREGRFAADKPSSQFDPAVVNACLRTWRQVSNGDEKSILLPPYHTIPISSKDL